MSRYLTPSVICVAMLRLWQQASAPHASWVWEAGELCVPGSDSADTSVSSGTCQSRGTAVLKTELPRFVVEWFGGVGWCYYTYTSLQRQIMVANCMGI